MIALTIFSRAASSVTKARVVVTKAERQTISHEIRMNGTIEAKDNFMQYVPSGLMVKSLGVSPGQQVQSGDVLFTVDTKKLQEKIGELEAEIAIAKKRENISISRAERTYQNAVSDAKEEKALAYRNYAGTVSAQDGYEAVAREQDKLMRAAALIADSAGGRPCCGDIFRGTPGGTYRGQYRRSERKNLVGSEEEYVADDVAIAEENASEPGDLAAYSLSSDIPGDLFPVGSSVSVTIDNQSEQYNICVPLQSLRQNGNYQYFIYVATEQDTVFGKEMVAKEMPVTILDKNERYAAIQEAVSEDVIVSASKDIIDGSRVKIIE